MKQKKKGSAGIYGGCCSVPCGDTGYPERSKAWLWSSGSPGFATGGSLETLKSTQGDKRW